MLVVVLGAVGALVGIPLAFAARSKIRRSGGTLKGSGLALAALIVGFAYVGLLLLAIAIPVFIGRTSTGPSVQDLDSSVRGQITGPAANQFGATDVESVVCGPPDQWVTGTAFTCVAYGTTGTVVGEYYGTVEPNTSDGIYQWDGRYVPSG